MKRFLILLLCVVGMQQVWADNAKFRIVRKATNEPVENANICWQLVQNQKKNGFGIGDSKGMLELPIPVGQKAVVAASCIGYKTLVDTIVVQKTNVLKLEQDVFNLSQVVVVGHSVPTPIDSSLYKVRVIDQKKILSSGATNLGELFLTEPNIKISSDLILGANIEMLGMSGSNVKVMVDGVPIIGRLNAQLDLSEITLDNVDHIEIIEGPMSVVYGNNALAGTINIITHKNKFFNTEVRANLGYEDVQKFDGGVNVSHKVGKNIFRIAGNYSNFQGVDFDKSTRLMEWKPKQQYTLNAGYILKLKNWTVDAKASFYNSKLTIKSNIQDYKVYDTCFFTDRYSGVANLKGKWNKNNHLNVLVSHSFYKRSSQEEAKDLTTLESIKEEKKSSQKERNSLLRAVWNHQFETANPLSLESGIDFNLSSMNGERIKGGSQNLNDYALFANLRYRPWEKVELQPGVRVAHNTGYDAPVVYSLNAKWDIAENLSWRISAAKGFRAPTVKELYYVFIDSNHEIYGNPDLKAEHSYNYNTSLDYTLSWNENNHLKTNLQLYYNDVDNLIYLIQRQNSSGYEYGNIAKYKTRGGNLGFTYFYKNWLRLNASGILTARYNRFSEVSDTRGFNTSLDFISGMQIREPKSKITFNADLKLHGKQNYFYYGNNDEVKEGNREAYEMLNASLSRKFWKNRLTVTVGAKNITNITDAKLNGRSSGGHSSGNSVDISYGRAFFVKANFRITK